MPVKNVGTADFMTNKQINLVRTSFEKIAPIAEKAAALFYAKQFDLNPRLRALFKGDVYEQGKKLMQVIAYAVEHLDRLDEIVPQVRDLGARHAVYGVSDRDYETVGAALLWTLEKALGIDFTAPKRAAWAAVYNLLADTMKEGSRSHSELRMFVEQKLPK
jgi:hemoglobin-like flavoprotein